MKKVFKSKKSGIIVKLKYVYDIGPFTNDSIKIHVGELGKIPNKVNKWLSENPVRVLSISGNVEFSYSLTNRKNVPVSRPVSTPPTNYDNSNGPGGGLPFRSEPSIIGTFFGAIFGSSEGRGLGRIGCGRA